VGAAVGLAVGDVGLAVGSAVGLAVGSAVGLAVGSAVGLTVGAAVGVGAGALGFGVAVGQVPFVSQVESGAAVPVTLHRPSHWQIWDQLRVLLQLVPNRFPELQKIRVNRLELSTVPQPVVVVFVVSLSAKADTGNSIARQRSATIHRFNGFIHTSRFFQKNGVACRPAFVHNKRA